jgi:hypothetical protein
MRWLASRARQCYADSTQLAHEPTSAKGQFLITRYTRPRRDSVRIRDGKLLVTDGPFMEREQLGGYFQDAVSTGDQHRLPDS